MFVVGLKRFCFAAKDAEMWYVNFCCCGVAAAAGTAVVVVVAAVAVLVALPLSTGVEVLNLEFPIVENGRIGVGETTSGFARDGDMYAAVEANHFSESKDDFAE
jgi:hypothetical protein